VQDKNIFGDDFQLKLSIMSTPLWVWWRDASPASPCVRACTHGW